MLKFKSQIIDRQGVERALYRISCEIVEKNRGCNNLYLVGICRRGVPLAQKLAKDIEKNEGYTIPCGELDISLYRDDIIAESPIINATHLPFDVTGKNIVLVDDVLYTGRTVRAAIDALIKLGRPATVQLAVLIDRGHREFPIRADYVGKNVPTSRSERISVNFPPFDENICVELFEEIK